MFHVDRRWLPICAPIKNSDNAVPSLESRFPLKRQRQIGSRKASLVSLPAQPNWWEAFGPNGYVADSSQLMFRADTVTVAVVDREQPGWVQNICYSIRI